VYSVIDQAVTAMKANGIRVKVDNRDHLRPGITNDLSSNTVRTTVFAFVYSARYA
jgi:hypothetical protein